MEPTVRLGAIQSDQVALVILSSISLIASEAYRSTALHHRNPAVIVGELGGAVRRGLRHSPMDP
jgi:hypothetical protein